MALGMSASGEMLLPLQELANPSLEQIRLVGARRRVSCSVTIFASSLAGLGTSEVLCCLTRETHFWGAESLEGDRPPMFLRFCEAPRPIEGCKGLPDAPRSERACARLHLNHLVGVQAGLARECGRSDDAHELGAMLRTSEKRVL